MTSKGRVATTTSSDSNAQAKVEGVQTSLALCCEEQEGMTTTTADMTQVTQITEAEIESAQPHYRDPMLFKEAAEDTTGLPHYKIYFMKGKKPSDQEGITSFMRRTSKPEPPWTSTIFIVK